MQRMRMQQGDQWSDHDHDGDDDELASLKPHSESDEDDEVDEEFEQARLKVMQRREEQAKQKVQLRLNPPTPESRDVKMADKSEAQPPKKPAWGRAAEKGRDHSDVRERKPTVSSAAACGIDAVAAGTAAEAAAAAAPPTPTTTPSTDDATDTASAPAALSAAEQSKQDEIIQEVQRQKQQQQQQQQQAGAAMDKVNVAFVSAGAAIQTARTDLLEAYQRMQAAQAEQEAARKKIEEDCRKQTEAFEARFAAVETVVNGLMGNLQKIEITISGLQGQVADARRVQEAYSESMMAMLRKLLPEEGGKAQPPAKSGTRRADSGSADGARGRSRSKERRLNEKNSLEASSGSTD